ncbi:hypothetical protein SAMN02910369_00732 [Lachnospiraceae bacterium NE2001]|nr:hypothetical protein SAMN02910369_00732 [Lachnospiraceae bacterium NE2001]
MKETDIDEKNIDGTNPENNNLNPEVENPNPDQNKDEVTDEEIYNADQQMKEAEKKKNEQDIIGFVKQQEAKEAEAKPEQGPKKQDDKKLSKPGDEKNEEEEAKPEEEDIIQKLADNSVGITTDEKGPEIPNNEGPNKDNEGPKPEAEGPKPDNKDNADMKENENLNAGYGKLSREDIIDKDDVRYVKVKKDKPPIPDQQPQIITDENGNQIEVYQLLEYEKYFGPAEYDFVPVQNEKANNMKENENLNANQNLDLGLDGDETRKVFIDDFRAQPGHSAKDDPLFEVHPDGYAAEDMDATGDMLKHAGVFEAMINANRQKNPNNQVNNNQPNNQADNQINNNQNNADPFPREEKDINVVQQDQAHVDDANVNLFNPFADIKDVDFANVYNSAQVLQPNQNLQNQQNHVDPNQLNMDPNLVNQMNQNQNQMNPNQMNPNQMQNQNIQNQMNVQNQQLHNQQQIQQQQMQQQMQQQQMQQNQPFVSGAKYMLGQFLNQVYKDTQALAGTNDPNAIAAGKQQVSNDIDALERFVQGNPEIRDNMWSHGWADDVKNGVANNGAQGAKNFLEQEMVRWGIAPDPNVPVNMPLNLTTMNLVHPEVQVAPIHLGQQQPQMNQQQPQVDQVQPQVNQGQPQVNPVQPQVNRADHRGPRPDYQPDDPRAPLPVDITKNPMNPNDPENSGMENGHENHTEEHNKLAYAGTRQLLAQMYFDIDALKTAPVNKRTQIKNNIAQDIKDLKTFSDFTPAIKYQMGEDNWDQKMLSALDRKGPEGFKGDFDNLMTKFEVNPEHYIDMYGIGTYARYSLDDQPDQPGAENPNGPENNNNKPNNDPDNLDARLKELEEEQDKLNQQIAALKQQKKEQNLSDPEKTKGAEFNGEKKGPEWEKRKKVLMKMKKSGKYTDRDMRFYAQLASMAGSQISKDGKKIEKYYYNNPYIATPSVKKDQIKSSEKNGYSKREDLTVDFTNQVADEVKGIKYYARQLGKQGRFGKKSPKFKEMMKDLQALDDFMQNIGGRKNLTADEMEAYDMLSLKAYNATLNYEDYKVEQIKNRKKEKTKDGREFVRVKDSERVRLEGEQEIRNRLQKIREDMFKKQMEKKAEEMQKQCEEKAEQLEAEREEIIKNASIPSATKEGAEATQKEAQKALEENIAKSLFYSARVEDLSKKGMFSMKPGKTLAQNMKAIDKKMEPTLSDLEVVKKHPVYKQILDVAKEKMKKGETLTLEEIDKMKKDYIKAEGAKRRKQKLRNENMKKPEKKQENPELQNKKPGLGGPGM